LVFIRVFVEVAKRLLKTVASIAKPPFVFSDLRLGRLTFFNDIGYKKRHYEAFARFVIKFSPETVGSRDARGKEIISSRRGEQDLGICLLSPACMPHFERNSKRGFYRLHRRR
jgi:hypothetical protein